MAIVTELELDSPAAEPAEHPIEPAEHYEVVDGRIVQEPPLGAQEVSIATNLIWSINVFDPSRTLGRAFAEMLFVLGRSPVLRRRPDVAFVSKERWPVNRAVPRENAWDVVPDLAVEITSPTDFIDELMDKVGEYFSAGVRAVWVVYSKHRKVYAYDSPSTVRIFQLGDELDGGAVLLGFRLPLTNLFEVEEGGPATTS